MNGARRRTDRSDRNRRGGIGLNLHLRLTHRYPCPASYVHAEISAIIYSRRARGHTRHTTRGPHEGSATPPARLPTAHDRPRTTRARTIYAENSVRAQLHNVVLRWPTCIRIPAGGNTDGNTNVCLATVSSGSTRVVPARNPRIRTTVFAIYPSITKERKIRSENIFISSDRKYFNLFPFLCNNNPTN